MEILPVVAPVQPKNQSERSDQQSDRFIVANTKPISLNSLQSDCTIPAFAKDNETTISHQDFIEVMGEVVSQFYSSESVQSPVIRVSHPIKGRIPEAKGKPAQLLEDHERTLYYERMAFLYDIPTVYEVIDGNAVNLTVGGIRAYNQENLYSKKSPERFKLFIGFKNQVCTNLCISTDGLMSDVRVQSVGELSGKIMQLLSDFVIHDTVRSYMELQQHSITDSQFAHLIGKVKMHAFLPGTVSKRVPRLDLQDAQISQVVKGFYEDENHASLDGKEISLWRLYNLFTGANKSSYIDRFLDRGVNASSFAFMLQNVLKSSQKSWYLI